MEAIKKLVGKFPVDSGRIRVGDPCVIDRADLCVEVDTGTGDGTYSVFEMEVDGLKYLAVQLNPFGIDLKEIFKDRPNNAA